MKTNLILITALVVMTSCESILLKSMFKDPKVENTATIKKFQTENDFSTANSLILKSDTSKAEKKLFLGMTVDYAIFDKNGNQMCYKGAITCHGIQFEQLMAGKVDSFEICKKNGKTLDTIIQQTYDLEEKAVDISKFKDTDYYIVSYWEKFFGGAKRYKSNVCNLEDLIAKSASNYKFTHFKINTDLQENWGYEPGGEAKLTLKKNSNNTMDIKITDFPIKK